MCFVPYAVLMVVNQIISGDRKFQENLALVGIIPSIIRFADRSFGNNLLQIRYQAAKFICEMCTGSKTTLQTSEEGKPEAS